MTVPNRTSLLDKLTKVLKKHYKAPPPPPADRDLLRQFLYALILEQASFEKADTAFARLEQSSFDWNEVRVTTTSEMAEWMVGAVEPRQAAANVKRFLHSVFESQYSFELDALKKQNLGKAQADLAKFTGASPFAISYVTQHTLGGHALPLRNSAYDVLYIVGILDQKERASRAATRIERAIPKKSGVEFAALLHQLAVDFGASPFSSRVRAILLEVNSDAKDRFPKRPSRKEQEEVPEPKEKAAKKGAPEPAAKAAKTVKGPAPPPKKQPPTKKAKPVATKGRAVKATKRTKVAAKKPARKKSLGYARLIFGRQAR